MVSMTGYGRGDATNGVISITVELRSVNHRFRDLNLKVPREYAPLEPRILALLRERFNRGRIDCAVRRTSPEGQLQVTSDPALAESLYREMCEIARRLQKDTVSVDLSLLFQQPGVLVVCERDLDVSHEWDLLEPALQGAITHLQDMREFEGAALQREFDQHVEVFQRLLSDLDLVSRDHEERTRRRLEDKLRRLIGEQVDPVRIVQEAAFLADKADIAEEISRLASHCEQVRILLDAKEPMGRKLEFLTQEMSREVNTIGSKALGQQVSPLIVEMKATIEKIREQSANIE